ncbi:MAG: hypothetical protein ABF651_01550 [Sporolactobacillus sp.]
MAKEIASIKMPMYSMNGPNLRRTLRFYEMIKKSHCTAYFSIDGKTYSVKELPKALTLLSSLKKKEILVVIEGEGAERLHQQLLTALRVVEENARENPGLYRQS